MFLTDDIRQGPREPNSEPRAWSLIHAQYELLLQEQREEFVRWVLNVRKQHISNLILVSK